MTRGLARNLLALLGHRSGISKRALWSASRRKADKSNQSRMGFAIRMISISMRLATCSLTTATWRVTISCRGTRRRGFIILVMGGITAGGSMGGAEVGTGLLTTSIRLI